MVLKEKKMQKKQPTQHFWSRLICLVTFILYFFTATATPPNIAICQVSVTHKTYPCIIGKNGITVDKQEGDGATPAGSFLVREIFYRPDKLSKTDISRIIALRAKGLSVHALTIDDGWSDDVRSAHYNQWISIREYLKTPTVPSLSYEKLWRKDAVYNIIVVLGFNDEPVVKGKGSAIFMHLQREVPRSTVGCVALALPDLLDMLAAMTVQTRVDIPAQGDKILIHE